VLLESPIYTLLEETGVMAKKLLVKVELLALRSHKDGDDIFSEKPRIQDS